MKTLLEMGQDIAIKARIKIPIALIGNTDKNARVILLSIQEAADEMVREYNWTQLISYHEYTVNHGDFGINLGDDFDRLVDDTVWSLSDNAKLLGPIGYDEWQEITAQLITPISSCFSISNPTKGRFGENPEMRIFSVTGDNLISFYRVSKNHVYIPGSDSGQVIQEFTSDNQSTIMDNFSVYQNALARTLQTLGMSYADEQAKYNDLMMERVNRDRGSKRVSMNSRSAGPGRYSSKYFRGKNDPIGVNLPPGGWR